MILQRQIKVARSNMQLNPQNKRDILISLDCSRHTNFIIKFQMSLEIQGQSYKIKMENVQEAISDPAKKESLVVNNYNIISLKKIAQLDYSSLQDKATIEKTTSKLMGHSQQIETENAREQWTFEDQEQLIILHNQKGNRWVQIAKELQKSDNAVKNHYHSRFRRTIRKVNKFIVDNLRAHTKPLKNSVISKIIQTAQGLYCSKADYTREQSERAYQLKNRLLAHSGLGQQIGYQKMTEIKSLVSQIEEFIKQLKTKNKTKQQEKSQSNKYKGKQIISLLTQNSLNHVLTNPEHNSRRSIRGLYCQESKSIEEPSKPKKQYSRSSQEPKQTQREFKLGSPNSLPEQYHPFFIFNQGMMPIQPMIYSFCSQHNCPQKSIFFSGRHSSFSSYNSQKENNEGLANWQSIAQMDLESNNRNELHNENPDILKGLGTNSSLS